MKKMDGNVKIQTYKKSELDEIIISEILELAFDESEIDSKVKRKPSTKADTLKTRISEIDKQIGKLMDLYQIGSIPLEQIGTRIKPLNKERETLEIEIQSNVEHVLLSTTEARKIVRTAEGILAVMIYRRKRQLIDSLISKIVIYPNEIKIF